MNVSLLVYHRIKSATQWILQEEQSEVTHGRNASTLQGHPASARITVVQFGKRVAHMQDGRGQSSGTISLRHIAVRQTRPQLL